MGKLKERWNKIPITVKVSTAYLICSILQKCLSFITLPLFTHLLTKEQYGQLTIYESWIGILSIFLTLNLVYGSFSKAMVKYESDRNGYIASIEGICLTLAVLFLILYLPLQDLWNGLFELPTPMVCLMVIDVLGVTAIQLWSGKKRFEFKYKSVVGITLGMSILSPILAYILIMNTDEKGYARILGYSLVTVCVGVFFYFCNVIKGKKIYNKEYWKYALGFNVPLLVYYLSQAVFNQSDRIMISHMVGMDKAAVYGVSYNLAMLLSFVLNAINNSYLPWLYSMYKSGKNGDNKKIGNYIAILFACMIIVVIWLAPEIILIMAGEQYYESRWIVPPVAMSLFTYLYVTYSTNVEFYFEEKRALVRASLGSAIINVVLNIIFIPSMGYIAAGYTTLISYILFAIYNYVEMKSIITKNCFSDGYDWKKLLVIYLVFMIFSWIGVGLYAFSILRIIIVIVGLVIAFIMYRKGFLEILK